MFVLFTKSDDLSDVWLKSVINKGTKSALKICTHFRPFLRIHFIRYHIIHSKLFHLGKFGAYFKPSGIINRILLKYAFDGETY